MIAPPIYDWRKSLVPTDQTFVAGGQAVSGGLTLGGAAVVNPEPGGRAVLAMAFPALFAADLAQTDASWTISRSQSGAVFRVRLCNSVQLVPTVALDVADTGQTWANGEPWANDENWRANPFALVASAASRGAAQIAVDLSVLGQVLQIGHVIGFFLAGYDFAHIVMDIDYDADDLALVTIQPPLRRPVVEGDLMLFRPSMLVTGRVDGTVVQRRRVSLGAVNLVEALV